MPLFGKKVSDGNCLIKGVARRSAIFAGRLDKETTCESLLEFLKSNSIIDPFCRKLSDKDKLGREYKTSAFMISSDHKSFDILNNLDIWPDTISIRPWMSRNAQ